MSNRDWFDDEKPTRLPGNTPPGGNRGGWQPHNNFDDSELPTRLNNFDNNYAEETQLPKNSRFEDDDRTMLGPEEEEVRPLGFLIIKRPLHHRGHVHKVSFRDDRGYQIGRKSGQLILETDRRISESHARIKFTEHPDTGEPVFTIVDLDSRTGTFLNGDRIDGRRRLNEGDEIKIGDYIFVFKMLMD